MDDNHNHDPYHDPYQYQYGKIDDAEKFTMVLASISVLFPLSVVFILIQRYEQLVRGKSLIHYVLMTAIADTITSIIYAFGYPMPNTLECKIQGFSWFFFGRMR